jgi:hypothetical protein
MVVAAVVTEVGFAPALSLALELLLATSADGGRGSPRSAAGGVPAASHSSTPWRTERLDLYNTCFFYRAHAKSYSYNFWFISIE